MVNTSLEKVYELCCKCKLYCEIGVKVSVYFLSSPGGVKSRYKSLLSANVANAAVLKLFSLSTFLQIVEFLQIAIFVIVT